MTENTAVIAITKHGIDIAKRIMEKMPEVQVYAPVKYANSSIHNINWFKEQTSQLIEPFKKNDALICIVSLVGLIAPLLVHNKADPAVVVIDDKTHFVISALSGLVV